MVVTGSIYGHTAKAAEALKKFIPGGKYFDASKTNISYLVSEAFKVKTIVIASITHEGEIFPPIEDFLIRLTHLGLKGRNFAIIENGLWLPTAGKKIKEYIEKIPSSTLIEPIITIKGSLKEEQNKDLDLLASKIKETF
jgi:flavorubredoxin